MTESPSTGEYPISASLAAEQNAAKVAALEEEDGEASTEETADQSRGQAVILTFSQQGIGALVNVIVLLVLLIVTGQTSDSYDRTALELVWRLQYGLGALTITCVAVARVMYTQESEAWTQSQADGREAKAGGKTLLFTHYWPRLIGTSMTWLVWDIVFYGNKLFQGKFITIIEGGRHPTIYSVMKYSVVNCTVALVGYWCAAVVIDRPWMGRLRLQILGFFMVTIVFFICGGAYQDLIKEENIHTFQFLYYLSSFFGQFGPNCTTFLLASELYPTEVRTIASGFSSTMGKIGALFAAVYFSNPDLTPETIFLVCGWCGLIGLVLTVAFVADVTTLDSRHIDLQWKVMRHGSRKYYGPALRAEYQSFFETWVLRRPVLSEEDEAGGASFHTMVSSSGGVIPLEEFTEDETEFSSGHPESEKRPLKDDETGETPTVTTPRDTSTANGANSV